MGNSMPVSDERVKKIVNRLELEKTHVRKFYKVFQQYDKDRSGTIELEEFYMMVGEKPSVFGDSIFELIDVDGNGGLEFSEFVEASANFCMMGKEDILKFCFYIFDKDKNGYIEEDELHDLIGILHGSGTTANIETALEALQSGEGRITFPQFSTLHNENPQVLYPAFRMQFKLQKITLGVNYWSSRKAMFKERRQFKKDEAKRIKKEQDDYLAEQKELLVKRRMGAFRYYCCVGEREKYEETLTEDDLDVAAKELEANAKKKKKKTSKASPKMSPAKRKTASNLRSKEKKTKSKRGHDKKKEKKERKEKKKKKKKKKSQWD